METAHHYVAVDAEVVDQVEAVDQVEVAVEMTLNHVALAVDGAQLRICTSRGRKSACSISDQAHSTVYAIGGLE